MKLEILQNLKIFLENSIEAFPGKNSLFSYLFKSGEINFGGILTKLTRSGQKYFYWNEPQSGIKFLAVNPLLSIKTSGSQRINDAENLINYWQKNFINNWYQLNLDSVPLFVGGIKFSPDQGDSIWSNFSDSEWFVPKFLFLKHNNDFYLAINFLSKNFNARKLHKEIEELQQFLDAKDAYEEVSVKFTTNLPNDKEEWQNKVRHTLKRISKQDFKKIVLSRRVEMELSSKPDIHKILNDLESKYPSCHIFAFSSNDSVFFGASPETLAKISGGYIEADALAGSFPRGNDKTEDEKYSHELLHSEKNLAEQNAVVEFIVSSFSEFSNQVVYDVQPKVKKLPNIQHLWTPIKANIQNDKSIFSIIRSIFPTPAICGIPWSQSMDFIREVEGFNRGLYAGIIGWFNFNTESKLAVAIRSALLNGKKLYAFAGCGIIEGSDPESEYLETELKLKPILSLFEVDNIKNAVN